MPRPLQDETGLPPLESEEELGTNAPAEGQNFDPMSLLQAVGGFPSGSVNTNEYEALRDLHPYSQILSLSDVDSCLKLEEATFPEHHRCSREKLVYRLTKCSELCLGLFTSAEPDSPEAQAATAPTAKAPDSSEPKRKGILLAHLIATKTKNELVQDDDMEIPDNWQNESLSESKSSKGHIEEGRTLAIHSLAVLPAYQRRGLGTVLMKAYVQRMVESEVADSIALLTYDNLIQYYENLGFENKGKSRASFGGGNWNDMLLEFKYIRPQSDEEEEDDD